MILDTPRQPCVAAIGFTGPEREMLEEAAGSVGPILYAAHPLVRASPVDCRVILVSASGTLGMTLTEVIRRQVKERPDATITVVAIPDRGAVRGIPRALRAGATVVSVSSSDELRSFLTGHCTHSSRADDLSMPLACVAKSLPRPLARLLGLALKNTGQRLTVTRLAALAEVSPRTLSRSLRRRGWPPPGELIRWAAAIRNAWHDDNERGGHVVGSEAASRARTQDVIAELKMRLGTGAPTR